ncbi:MAG: FAD-dependent oxidoreductase [Bacteroidetes bacterium]|nr:FAD-dependent oxidoreductase [Bacteroidota bacterium]
MELKNRIIMSPMGSFSHGPEGEITERTVNYYAERAKGGVGFIICQSSIIMAESKIPNRPSVYDDKFIPGLRRVADAIHSYNCKAAFQIVHHGKLLIDHVDQDHPSGIKAFAPSAIPRLLRNIDLSQGQEAGSFWVRGNAFPLEAGKEDIERIIQAFAEGARRIKEAGFDAVEIHGGHGYLISQFLSPLHNHRQDEYGGSSENRARFACEIIRAVRAKVGPDFTVIFRLSGSDFMTGGINITECVGQAPLFEKAGADALDISASEQGSIDWQYPSFLFPAGPLVHLAEAIKKVVSIPVIAVAKLGDPRIANEVLEAGKADFIALGRSFLADPAWPKKVENEQYDDIRSCIYCVNCLNFEAHPEILKYGLHCSVNPAVLREQEFSLSPAPNPKKVCVIGCGPAGMEAARTLAERGHSVTIYEKNSYFGGQWFIASNQRQKRNDYSKLLTYLERGLQNAGVSVRLNTEATLELVKSEQPDAVVVATGATPITLDDCITDGSPVAANDVILGNVSVGNKVIVIGGRHLGMEIADQLADEGKNVTLVSRRSIGRNVERNVYLTLRNRLIAKEVKLFPCCPLIEIREKGIYVVYQNDLVFLEADSIVMAVGVKANNELFNQLKNQVKELYQIGDCVQPRDVMAAIREGAETGRII